MRTRLAAILFIIAVLPLSAQGCLEDLRESMSRFVTSMDASHGFVLTFIVETRNNRGMTMKVPYTFMRKGASKRLISTSVEVVESESTSVHIIHDAKTVLIKDATPDLDQNILTQSYDMLFSKGAVTITCDSSVNGDRTYVLTMPKERQNKYTEAKFTFSAEGALTRITSTVGPENGGGTVELYAIKTSLLDTSNEISTTPLSIIYERPGKVLSRYAGYTIQDARASANPRATEALKNESMRTR